MNKIFGATLICSVLMSGAANAAVIAFEFTGNVYGNPYDAKINLTVIGGQATGGIGTITGGGLGTQTLTLITLASPGVEDDGGGLLGYRSNDGTDWFDADTTIPIDANGLIFAVGPGPVGFGTSQQFDVYSVGPDSYAQAFFGHSAVGSPSDGQEYYTYGDAVTVTSHAVPEPATLALLGAGLGGLAARRRKARKSA